ncbi:nucleoplasmin-like protein [Drosophila virilis]|uniref:Nucleoplasmin core domain-containing protein n=1 Tax=Drosophila virilis TaxID=7244 RepID=B4MGY6_DROVI|nr:nucleoplasmin-like protein [Drosophila virilis]EDW57369.1 uncharacterized protein Dvir_GJ16333 [Drosophila virilis]
MSGLDNEFFGFTLTAKNNIFTWDSDSRTESWGHKLLIKQILLDDKAKDDEYNVVNVDSLVEEVRLPIAVLRAGELRVIHPNLEFYESRVTFTLSTGSGPVHIYGQNIKDNLKLIYIRGAK